MAALDFPAAPSVDDTYTANGRTWTWNGETWRATAAGNGSAGALDFPGSPSADEIHSQNGRSFQWNEESWRALGTAEAGDAWTEIARQGTIAAGKLTLSGLDLSGFIAVRLMLIGITATDDDTQVQLRFHVDGSEVATGYQWGVNPDDAADSGQANSANVADDAIHLTHEVATWGLGNAAAESLGGRATVYEPGSATLDQIAYVGMDWIRTTGDAVVSRAVGSLTNTGALTGCTVFGSSDLTGGLVIVLGLE